MTTPVLGVADVLLVEDDPGDVMLTRDSFDDCHLGLNLHVASDGEEALSFLHRAGEFAGVPRPALILLDLNMPMVGGLDALSYLQQTQPDTPVVVVTSQNGLQAVENAVRLGAAGYILKQNSKTQIVATLRRILESAED